MNNEFKCDYYRMTGRKLSFSPSTPINFIRYHNIRYMYWWRAVDKNGKNFIAQYKLFKYTKKYGLEIGRGARIGKGLYIGHPYNITVSSQAKLGDNVNLSKGCAVGSENRGKRAGAPNIGNNVFIGLNAVVVGKISIGDDVLIAPNAFVNFDVPSHSIVIGNPAKIIRKENAAEGYVNFRV